MRHHDRKLPSAAQPISKVFQMTIFLSSHNLFISSSSSSSSSHRIERRDTRRWNMSTQRRVDIVVSRDTWDWTRQRIITLNLENSGNFFSSLLNQLKLSLSSSVSYNELWIFHATRLISSKARGFVIVEPRHFSLITELFLIKARACARQSQNFQSYPGSSNKNSPSTVL